MRKSYRCRSLLMYWMRKIIDDCYLNYENEETFTSIQYAPLLIQRVFLNL